MQSLLKHFLRLASIGRAANQALADGPDWWAELQGPSPAVNRGSLHDEPDCKELNQHSWRQKVNWS